MQQQKADQQQQAQDMKALQEQVASLIRRDSTVSATQATVPTTTVVTTLTSASTVPTSSLTPAPRMTVQTAAPQTPYTTPGPAPNPIPASVPQSISAAASNLAASLQACLGSGSSYGGLTMDHLRSNPMIANQAAAVLSDAIQNVAPLQANTALRSQVNSVDQLFKATTVNKQLRAYEFASTGQFSYHSQLKLDNVNAVAFAYGSFKHLEACKTGLIPNVSDQEFLARLRHLRNVFEIACLSSSLSSFSESAWHIAREYDNRVISDIESGAKSWNSLSNGIEPDSIYCAKETVENRLKAKKTNSSKDIKKDPAKKDRKACTTFNTHRSSEGCFWEHQNKGETCVFEHFCSWCKQNRNAVEKHKAFNCEFKPSD